MVSHVAREDDITSTAQLLGPAEALKRWRAKRKVPGRPEDDLPADQREAEPRPRAERAGGEGKFGVRVDVQGMKKRVLEAREKLQSIRERPRLFLCFLGA